MSRSENQVRRALLVVLGLVLLVSLVYLLVIALGGAELVRATFHSGAAALSVHNPRPWLIAATVAGILLLGGLVRAEMRLRALEDVASAERRATEAAEEARERLAVAERERAQIERERDRLERERDEVEREREQEQEERQQADEAWLREREWNRQLREQILAMQRKHGVLGRHDDVREMLLELTMGLVDAEKGLLLSKQENSRGDFEVVCFLGFENDPQHSAVAQRFAREVIERDQTIREDDERRVDAEKRTSADEEVENLLAIPIYLSDEFSGVILCANREGGFEELQEDVLVAVGDHAGAVLQNARLHGDLRSAYLATIRVLANAIELKDPELRGHSDSVSEYVLAVADRLNFEPRRREELIFASLLHDVGKLGISERILLKPAGLTDEERSVIQLHPRIGYQLVRQVPALQSLAPAVLHHHERFDGDGYPGSLRGEAIPLEARIIAIADAFSAMTTDRPYSQARPAEEACQELERCAGGQFDPEVVRLFVEEVRRHPPEEPDAAEVPADAELELHRADGEFVLGAPAFGMTDSLTLLYSHRHFHETARAHAQRAVLQERPFAILIVELIDLPTINHEQGFAAGDAALQDVAAVAQRVAGRSGGLAFRASGRRIALLCPAHNQDAADRVMASLENELPSVPEARVGAAAWRPGESGEDVIATALRRVAERARQASSGLSAS